MYCIQTPCGMVLMKTTNNNKSCTLQPMNLSISILLQNNTITKAI